MPFTETDQIAFRPEIDTWNRVMRGGVIVCETPGKAVNLRYRMYKIRKKMQSQGATPYDDLTISLDPGDHRLIVRVRNSFAAAGITEIIPADVTDQEIESVDDRNQSVVVSRRKPLIQEG